MTSAGTSTSSEVGAGIAVDGSGNSYVAGHFTGTVDFDPGTEVEQLVASGDKNYFVAKYDASGNLEWVKSTGTSTNAEQAVGIGVDGSGNSYVTGYFSGTVDFEPGTGVTQLVTGGTVHFVAKYDASGNLAWAKSASSSGVEQARGIAVDGSGNSYITGLFQGTVDFDPGTGVTQLAAAGEQDYFVAKYDAAGNLEWAKSTGTSTDLEQGNGIAADGSGNSYVAGYFSTARWISTRARERR